MYALRRTSRSNAFSSITPEVIAGVMLRNVTRGLERRRRLPIRVLHEPWKSCRLPPHLGVRHAASSEVAVSARHDEPNQQSSGPGRRPPSLRQTRRPGPLRPTDGYINASGREADSRRDAEDEPMVDSTDLDRDTGGDSHGQRWQGIGSGLPSLLQAAGPDTNEKQLLNRMSPSIVMRKALGSEPDAHYWRTAVSKARSPRLPIVLVQMLFLKEWSRYPGGSALHDLLPSQEEWDRILKRVSNLGHSSQDLDDYLYILQGRTDDERCERLLERNAPGSMFLFTFLTRTSANITKATTLHALIQSCQSYYEDMLMGESGRQPRAHRPARSLRLNHDKFCLVMGLLSHQCLRLEPRLIINVAKVAARYIERLAAHVDESRKVFVIQCRVFNEVLGLFRPRPAVQAVQGALPNAYFWEAQRIVLAASAGLRKPLLVDVEGFRAVREVLAGQAKNQKEAHSAARHAATWPPYLEPGDGMDERAEPEDNWSRAVSAGMLMQEAGFAKEEQDYALDILQGMMTDGTPTIQQRALMGPGRRVGVWEASIRATRNAQEAWERFRNPPAAASKPGPAQYAAMFEKLVLREAEPESRILPGDKALSFATNQEANLAEFERARLRPPSVAQLYQQMLLNGVRPQGTCLQILVANAESVDTAHRYLRDSAENNRLAQALMADGPDGAAVKAVPMGLFAAYVQACLRMGGRRGGRQLTRAIRLVDLRLGSERSARWVPYVWGLILKNLSRHRNTMGVSLAEQLKLSMDITERIEESHGITLPTFVQFAKLVRKAVRRELAGLAADLESAGSAERNPLRLLYKYRRTGAGEPWHAPGARDPSGAGRASMTALDAAVGRMKDMFARLVEQEKDRQRLLDADNVAPLDRMACRTDPVGSEHAREYMLSLAFVGQFDEMARTLRWLMEEWAQEEVVLALGEVGEPPPYADFSETLCAFRLLAEPMLAEGAVETLRQGLAALPTGWTWPDDEAVATYAEAVQVDESMATLRRVLDWARHGRRGGGAAEAESEAAAARERARGRGVEVEEP